MRDFGRLLFDVRHDARPYVSHTTLARRAGLHESYVSRLESGTRRPSRGCVEKLATALALTGTKRDEFMVVAGYVPRDVPTTVVPYIVAVIQAARVEGGET